LRVFISDMEVRVAGYDAVYFPDVLLTCEPSEREPLDTTAPCLIAEVMKR
jgi:hypothetical protein